MNRLCVYLCALLALAVTPAAADSVSLIDQTPHVTTSGLAQREVAPDTAVLNFGVVTERPTARAAADENARAAQAVLTSLKAQGIAPADIATTTLDLSSVYDVQRDANGRETKRTLRGYAATNEIRARVRDLAKAGAIAQQVIDSGANHFQGVSFEVSDRKAIEAELWGEAIRAARDRARAYAEAIGARLGRLLEIRSEANAAPIDTRMSVRQRNAPTIARESAPIPIEPGLRTFSSEPVSATWELAQ